MQRSPLTVEHYFYTRIDISANPKFNPEAEECGMQLATDTVFLRHTDDPCRWQVTLSIDLSGKENENCPYHGKMEVVGLFRVQPVSEDDEKETKVRRIIGANGPAVLFSAAREMFLIICGRGPWPVPQWPTVHFKDTIPEEDEEDGRSEARVPKG